MPKIILCRGIQGSGKTTWAKKWAEEDPEHRVRWNNDDFRRMLGPYWIPEREELIHRIMKEAIDNAMLFGYDIVIDNMNLNPKHWNYIQSRIHDFNHDCHIVSSEKQYTLEFKDFFDVSLEECIERDSKRPNPTGEEVIKATYEKYKSILEGGEK